MFFFYFRSMRTFVIAKQGLFNPSYLFDLSNKFDIKNLPPFFNNKRELKKDFSFSAFLLDLSNK